MQILHLPVQGLPGFWPSLHLTCRFLKTSMVASILPSVKENGRWKIHKDARE
jgi:hypothetical protein